MGYTTGEIAAVVEGKLFGNASLPVEWLVIDSRKLAETVGSMFIAIEGERHNGHDFVESMYQKGIRVFLVSSRFKSTKVYADAAFIQVEDTILALQKLAAWHRKHFTLPVLAITGSNGKTIVKEWLAQCMASRYKITRSPRSYNSQIGVPLSVWLLDRQSEWAIFEAGISLPDEMDKLEAVVNPAHGLITNIGEAHQQNFLTLESKLHEKIKLFKHCEKVFYCRDHEMVHQALMSIYPNKKFISWSMRVPSAKVYVSSLEEASHSTKIQLHYHKLSATLTLPFSDKASIENALHVITYLLAAGFSFDEVKEQVSMLHLLAMRMEQIKGIKGCLLINDAYNSDENALAIALDYIHQQLFRKKVLILSDIQQAGTSGEVLYQKVAALVKQKGIDKFIGIGKELYSNAKYFQGIESAFYSDTDEFLRSAELRAFSDQIILIKGARGFQFERIVQSLAEKNHTTLLETNLNNLVDNLNYFRAQLSEKTGIMVMVKALAYGSGGSEIASVLQHEKVNYLGVAFTDEGVQLRQAGIHLPIMVMSPGVEDFSRMVDYELEPEIYSPRILDRFLEMAEKQLLIQYPVHIKLDTGMHRLGFTGEHLEWLLKRLKSTSCLKVKSVFSHLAASDEPEHDWFTNEQVSLFKQMSDAIAATVGYQPMRHILNSAGIERFPEAHFEMVRLGIGLHGVSSVQSLLKPVSSLKTHISQIKKIPRGETVGYSRKGKADTDFIIAILPVGYADGLDRKLGNGNGYVTIDGHKAPYVGTICMDMCMVDITYLKCEEGDEVVVFGNHPSIIELAEQVGTIPYEILTNVSSRVKRIYIKD